MPLKEKKRKDYAFWHEFNEKSDASAGQKAERGGACKLQKAAKGTCGHQVESDSGRAGLGCQCGNQQALLHPKSLD